MAAKLIDVFNNCKCVREEQHLAAGEVRSLAFGDNRSVMVVELGLHEVVRRDAMAKVEKQLARQYGLDRVCIEPRYEMEGELSREYICSLYDDMAARMPSARGLLHSDNWEFADGALHIPMDTICEKHFETALRHLEARIRRETGRSCPVHAVPLEQTDGGPVLARTVVLATGAGPRRLGLPQEDELHGVSYCAACDGAFFRGKDVAVVGGGNSAVSEALLLSRLCRHVSLVHRRSTFRAAPAGLAALEKQSNVTFCRNSIVTELLGRERLTGIRLQNGRELEISGLFVCIGRTPVSALGGEQLRRTPDGYYCADETTRTGLPGVFAAGDVREKQLRQIVTAVSDGAAAAQQAEHYLGKTSRRAEI